MAALIAILPLPALAAPHETPSGGVLSELLLGSALAAWLQGRPAAGLGLLDLALLGLGAYGLWRLFGARAGEADAHSDGAPNDGGPDDGETPRPTAKDHAQAQWARLRSTPRAGMATSPEPPASDGRQPLVGDPEEFLRGARLCYQRVQAAWDDRHLEPLRGLLTPQVLAALEARLAETLDAPPTATRILLLDAVLEGVRREGPWIVAAARLSSLQRSESLPADGAAAREATAETVIERWSFRRSAGDPNSFWAVSAIEALDGPPVGQGSASTPA